MLPPAALTIRPAQPSEDALLAQHFYQLWLDNNLSSAMLIANWQEVVIQFIARARQTLDYQAFVAVVENYIVGSVGCQRFAGLYPNIFQPEYRCDGYIWGMYVEPAYRQQGIGKQLMGRSLGHLQSIGCTHAVLNASPFGKALYAQLGFEDSNLMRLSLGEDHA